MDHSSRDLASANNVADALVDGARAPDAAGGRRNPDPGQAFREAFTSEAKASIVAAVQLAYDIVQERHDEKLGYNANTFGHNVYHIGKHQLDQCCAKSGGKLSRVDELKTLFRLQGGEYTLGFYKVGHSAETDIWEAFPTSENGAMSLNAAGQPVLLGLEDAMMDDVADLRYAVVAHLGNPTDGLCAVYLCIPVRTESGKITRWGFTEPLYVTQKVAPAAAQPTGTIPPLESVVLPAAPEEIPEADFVVTAKKTS